MHASRIGGMFVLARMNLSHMTKCCCKMFANDLKLLPQMQCSGDFFIPLIAILFAHVSKVEVRTFWKSFKSLNLR